MRYFKLITIYFMSFAYAYVGVRHFIDPDFFLAIMPNYLTFHLEFVYLSGVAEVVLGLMLLSKKTTKFFSFKCPARLIVSWLIPSMKSPSLAITYVLWLIKLEPNRFFITSSAIAIPIALDKP